MANDLLDGYVRARKAISSLALGVFLLFVYFFLGPFMFVRAFVDRSLSTAVRLANGVTGFLIIGVPILVAYLVVRAERRYKDYARDDSLPPSHSHPGQVNVSDRRYHSYMSAHMKDVHRVAKLSLQTLELASEHEIAHSRMRMSNRQRFKADERMAKARAADARRAAAQSRES